MLLPDPPRRGDIHFVFAKSLSYNRRLQIAAVLLVVGGLLQVVSIVAGAFVLLAASLLTIVKGYTNQPATMKGKREWRAGEKAQLLKITDIPNRSKQWDQTAIDITCKRGFATLFLGGLAVMGLAVALAALFDAGEAASVLVLDATVLLLPHWVTGVRSILKNAPLIVKVENLLYVYNLWELDKQADEAMTIQIEVLVLDPDQEIPTDAKLILQLPPMGEAFLGLQVQVVLNNVQGADYPYVYAVLVARPELKMRKRLSPEPPFGIVAEWKTDQGVDILVVRQATTANSGYYTNAATVSSIFAFARGEARKLLAFAPPPQPPQPLPSQAQPA